MDDERTGRVVALVRDADTWRPGERLCGFNLLGMFCKTKMSEGDTRIMGYFPEDRFRWMKDWGFNFARLPLDYRFFVKDGDWMRLDETQLRKLDDAVALGRKYGIHVNVNFHRAPGYCCNPPQEPKSLYTDPEPQIAFTNLWGSLARRYRGIPNDELTFDLVNEPAPLFGGTASNYAAVARMAIDAIHAVDPERFIMSDGWKWGNEPVPQLHPLPRNVGESIHTYSPHTLTHHGVPAMKLDKQKVCPPWPPKGWKSGRDWFLKNYFHNWAGAEKKGCFLHLGEFATYYQCPHRTAIAWMTDLLSVAQEKNLGWAMWNLDGKFGLLDNGRTDCELEDFEGHKLDREMLSLLQRFSRTEIVRFPSPHTRFVEATLVDQTDRHSDLYRELDRPLLGNEAHETNSASLFFLEDVLTGRGTAFLRLGPLPSARSDPSPDYALEPTRRRLVLFRTAYPLRRLDYEGGRLGRIRAAHRMQRMIRPYVEGRDGVFLTNTWGDGNRDGVINEAFMTREIAAGADLGVDVIQIDDGWQKGRSANSTAIKKGDKKMWGNFREDPTFWDFCPIRFPNGVEPFVKAAAEKGMKFGLWFGPDSANEAAAWERDADRLLDLHRRFGVDYFKLDSMKTPTRLAQERQGCLFRKLLDDSNGKIVVDLDVTAGVRPGYFGAVASGPVFVENRYIRKGDCRRWYPHHTLRELWLLSHAVDPVRLRMEVLNPTRLPELYAVDDPLVPSKWPADALFAITMFASPLGWFEIQNLAPETVAAWKPLVATWKRERATVQAGEIYPVGASPDGMSWTGFVSARTDGHGSALLFRELAKDDVLQLDLRPYCGIAPQSVEHIAGRGSATVSNGVLRVDSVPSLDFIWVKW